MTRDQLIVHLLAEHDPALPVRTRDGKPALAATHARLHAAGLYTAGREHDDCQVPPGRAWSPTADLDRLQADRAIRQGRALRAEQDGHAPPQRAGVRVRPAGSPGGIITRQDGTRRYSAPGATPARPGIRVRMRPLPEPGEDGTGSDPHGTPAPQ